MNFLFLYTELADYFINCCADLSKHGAVHIIRWPVNKEAPFQFTFPDTIKVYDKNDYTFEELLVLTEKINPSVIICSGWIDKTYLKIVSRYGNKIPTVLACDTKWKNSLKQWVAVLASPFYLKRIFSHAWVPGTKQKQYVKKLGFANRYIHTGFYCCNLNYFNGFYKEKSEQPVPKVFLFVGRYYDFKGLPELWQSFIELQSEQANDWQLWCAGTGTLEPAIHPKIRHFGFVQPNDIAPLIKQAGVFILPSRYEPWAVVVQEYAAAGFPLILSTEVGAAELFLQDNKNGFYFNKENSAHLKMKLKKIISLSEKELQNMSAHSHELAQQITPQSWSNTLLKICNAGEK